MAILDVVTVPDPLLREKARPIEKFDPELRQLANNMLETMAVAEGVGIAGPQVGLLQRLFVMRLREDDKRVPEGHPLTGKGLVLVNPEIIERNDEWEEGMEGCLSIPGYVGLVPRRTRIVVHARNEWGKPKRYEVEGFVARVMQHEIDHLDGILFLDRLTGDDKLFKVEPANEEASEASEETNGSLPADQSSQIG